MNHRPKVCELTHANVILKFQLGMSKICWVNSIILAKFTIEALFVDKTTTKIGKT